MVTPFKENRVEFKSGKVVNQWNTEGLIALGTTTPSTSAILMAAGASSTRATTALANKNFMEFRFENTATSGDNRGIYNRLYLGGAGGGGESLRSFTTIDDVTAGTAHGAHISMNFGTGGSITGLGVALRGTLHIPTTPLTGGTYGAVLAELWADDAASDISGTTSHAVWRTNIGGNATGAATAVNFASIDLPAAMIGSGTMVDTDITAGTHYGGLPIVINGVTRWIALVSA